MYCDEHDEIFEDDSMWWAQQDEERQQYEDDCKERADDMRAEFKRMGG